MIALLLSNGSLDDTIGYHLKEGSQFIGAYNLAGDSIEDYRAQMRLTQSLFQGRALNLTAHVIISPSPEDGRKLTINGWKEIAQSYLLKTKLHTHESILFLHRDRDVLHMHIVTNRINPMGKIYRNGNELVLSQRAGNEIAKERGMVQAKEIEKINKLKKQKGMAVESTGIVHSIREDVTRIAKGIKPSDDQFDFVRFFLELEREGYKVKKHFNSKTLALRGYGVEKDGVYFNASDLGKELTLKNLTEGSLKKVQIKLSIK